MMPSTLPPPAAATNRLFRALTGRFDLPLDAPVGASLRTPTEVIAAKIGRVDGDTLVVYADLPEVPEARCVLTMIVDAVARVDLPVRLRREAGGLLEARVDGVPLVVRRHVTINGWLKRALDEVA